MWLDVSRPSSKAALEESLVVTLWRTAVKLELKAVRTERQSQITDTFFRHYSEGGSK